MHFGDALALLKQGYLVTRHGWKGGMYPEYVFLVPGSHFAVNRKPLLGIFPQGYPIDYRPHIDMHTADGTIVVWTASQLDVLAEDWMIYDPSP